VDSHILPLNFGKSEEGGICECLDEQKLVEVIPPDFGDL
jgi:hypothetical protein